MCRAAVRELPAMGVGVSLLSEGSDPMTVAASSEASALVEELQFALGEGPCIDAYASRSPVLVPDLSATATATWPGYAPAAHEHGVRAVFAFPLQVGAARLGAMDVYRDHTGSLSAQALSSALTFAEVALAGLLDAGQGAEDVNDLIDDSDGNRFEVYQAQGMLMVQLGVKAGEALARLRAYAYAHDLRLTDVAHDVIERRVEMESDT
ncbi:MAG: GAF and ANTAR domain-containing protein [Marmoricola sp.]